MRHRYAALVALLAIAAGSPSGAGEISSRAESITVTLGGDLIGPVHPMNRRSDPQFFEIAELFRSADVGFVNQENSVFDLKGFAGYPAAETGGGYPLRYAAHAADLRDMGATLLSVANNHASDFGPEGVVATLKNLSDVGLVAGGTGVSDTAARGPVYLMTPKGAVALVATASTFPPASVAGPAIERHGTLSKARPGISALHVRKVRLLPPSLFQMLESVGGPLAVREGTAIRIGDQLFRQDRIAGIGWEVQPSDRDAILASVEEANKRAEIVLFSIHAHETAGDEEAPAVPFHPMVLQHANEAPSPNDPRPAGFQVELFHAAIDRGADVVARHGPHVIGGIEIYAGMPIFYGLGSLFLDFGGLRQFDTPSGETIVVPDSWFDSFVPVCEFHAGRVTGITLYPVAIEPGAGERSGSPALARGVRAQSILTQLKNLSAPFGTHIEIAGDVGFVTLK